jgi:predicted nucleotidyltransferase
MVTAASLATRLAGRITFDRERLAAFCRRWAVAELALFGSVLRDDFRPDSDADVLVAFAPGARRGLFDLVEMEAELAGLLGRRVDLVTRRAVEESDNWIRRRAILDSVVALPVVTFEAHSGPGAADARA